MSWMKYIFVVAQKAYLKKDDKFLIVRRRKKAKSAPNLWDFTGGKLEHGEDVKNSLKREIDEETKLKVNIGKPIFSFASDQPNNSYFSVVECEYVSGEVELSKEHSEYKWVTITEAKELLNECSPFLKEFLLQL
jgi:8-oxo-dGTP pyrophosphatase MutT (NUDIX family)